MTSTAARAERPGLVLRPMRATTYRTSPARPLAEVTMRPVEVWDEPAVRRLAHGRSDHVLNLVAPALSATSATQGRLVDRFAAEAVLRQAGPAQLYAWEWEVDGRRVHGVAGAVDLPLRGRLVPHEHTRPDVVAARAAQLVRSGVQAEPIMVLHDGSPLLALPGRTGTDAGNGAVIDSDAVVDSDAAVDLELPGERHRISALTDPARVAAVTAVVADAAPPIVADGHHRLAALDLVHAESASPGRAMVLVVDVATSDLTVGAVHRVLPGLDLDQVARVSGSTPDPVRTGDETHWIGGAEPGHLRWVLADANRLVGLDLTERTVHALRPGWVGDCSPVARDTCHLHSHLLPAWGVPESAVGYVHGWDRARAAAGAIRGLAVRSAAPLLAEVLGAARAGHLLPHKATSIGPKPRIGMLMLEADEHDGVSARRSRPA